MSHRYSDVQEKWYSLNGVVQPDVKASLILSGFGLALNIVANILLMLRFTLKTPKRWRMATTWVVDASVADVPQCFAGLLDRQDYRSGRQLDRIWNSHEERHRL